MWRRSACIRICLEPYTLSVCMRAGREAQKEGELAEKRMQRLEAARVSEVGSLSAELDGLRASADADARARDVKLNGLVEELGNTQALLTEKEAELAGVRPASEPLEPWLSGPRAWSKSWAARRRCSPRRRLS